jgi:hypothetical protein
MPPEAAYFGTFLMFIVLGLWLYVQDQEIQEEMEFYDELSRDDTDSTNN